MATTFNKIFGKLFYGLWWLWSEQDGQTRGSQYFFIIFFCGCITNYATAQTQISGIVTDDHKHPLENASVYQRFGEWNINS